MNWLLQRPIAHRGLHSGDQRIPENSLRAFEEAISHGYPIELDVHLLQDKRVVVFHDSTLRRLCDAEVAIGTLTSSDLKTYKLLGSNEGIPLLQDVLKLVAGRVPLLIELKEGQAPGFEQILFEELRSYGGEVAIQSFNPFLLRWFVKNAPSIPRGQLSSDFKGERMSILTKKFRSSFWLNFISRPHFIAYDATAMPNPAVLRLRGQGLPLICWTVRDKVQYGRVNALCDNIIFEKFLPNALNETLHAISISTEQQNAD